LCVSPRIFPTRQTAGTALRESGVLHINTIVNPLISHRHVQAGIGVKVAGNHRAVAEQLQNLPEVGMVLTTSGPHDLMLEVACQDKADLADFVGSRLRSIENVIATHTYTYLHKLAYTWSGLT
jgi:Lrp/AsnC family transcriptional regulator for asnA, asnC and gidA